MLFCLFICNQTFLRFHLERAVLQSINRSYGERAGVSIGTLYQYFADKEAVAQTLMERHVAEGAEIVRILLPGSVAEKNPSCPSRRPSAVLA